MAEQIVYKNVEIHQDDQIVLHDVNLVVNSGECCRRSAGAGV